MMNEFNKELEKLKEITGKLTDNGYLVDRASQWEFAFDALPDLVIIVNSEFKIKFVNKTLIKKTGLREFDLIDKYCSEVVIGKNSKTEINDVFSEDVYIKGNSNRLFNFVPSPIYDEDNNLLGFVCVLRDMLKSKHLM